MTVCAVCRKPIFRAEFGAWSHTDQSTPHGHLARYDNPAPQWPEPCNYVRDEQDCPHGCNETKD